MKKRDIELRVAENLRRLRENKGITQDALTTKMQILGCDMSRSTLAKIEVAQRHVYLNEIIYLKTALGISYDEMFDMSPFVPQKEAVEQIEEETENSKAQSNLTE